MLTAFYNILTDMETLLTNSSKKVQGDSTNPNENYNPCHFLNIKIGKYNQLENAIVRIVHLNIMYFV